MPRVSATPSKKAPSSAAGARDCLTLRRPGTLPFSGEVALCSSAKDQRTSVQLRPHTSVHGMLDDFASGRAFGTADVGQQHGAIQVSTSVAKGEVASITITMGWRFPHLDCKLLHHCWPELACSLRKECEQCLVDRVLIRLQHQR